MAKGKGVNGNLIPVTERTPEEQKAISSKGGRVAAERRRKRKNIAECVKAFMELDAPENAKKKLKDMGVSESDMSNGMLAVARIYQELMNGNVGAFKALLEAEKNNTSTVNLKAEIDPLSKSILDIAKDMENDKQ